MIPAPAHVVLHLSRDEADMLLSILHEVEVTALTQAEWLFCMSVRWLLREKETTDG